ncbi:MAG TPA: efflux RND transporter periplasmic adaptor subunit [Vicinamibacterales bacterium]|jgi:HlyD family secretion protein|nr:efflux RND transporter periplasmic adaptor subunit [Vicinamibacterales bacterium]
MKKSRKGLIVALLALLVVAGIWGFTALTGASPTIDPAKIAVVERGTMRRSVVATGKVEPITKVEIKSKANGIIEKLYVDVDQLVQPGQVLAELDRENLTARLRQARANLQAAEAAQEGAAAQLKKDEIQAEAPDVAFARRNAERAQQLFDQKLVSQSGLDDAKSALEQALNRQQAAQGQLVISRAKVSEAVANVAQSRAALENAEEDLANATIKAPIRATVLTRDVEIGSPVSSILNLGANGTLVFTLGDIDRVFVRGKVDEADIGRVRIGQPASITTETFRDRLFQGRVTQISPIGVDKDNVTTFEVKVSIDNPGKELKANMTANAEIILEELPDSMLVPEAAVFYDNRHNASVDLLDSSSRTGRRRVPVQVGVGNGTKMQVVRGINAGDKLVLPN